MPTANFRAHLKLKQISKYERKNIKIPKSARAEAFSSNHFGADTPQYGVCASCVLFVLP